MVLDFKPIWFDSMGCKSMCTMVKTPDTSVLIDPGISIMQPSFPASHVDKLSWLAEGEKKIENASRIADIIVISHYHFDHFMPDNMNLYKNKLILVKNPNEYINHSQRNRAMDFFSKLCIYFGNTKIEKLMGKRKKSKKRFPNPLKELPLSLVIDFGHYNKRRKQLLDDGMKRFKKMSKSWNRRPKIPEFKFENIEMKFADGNEFEFGDTSIRFTNALFHGSEFSSVGWIVAVVIQHKRTKLIHTSDINGPVVEDYTNWIIHENPNILIIDGPSTYLFGHVVNRTNMNRAIDNMTKIINECKSKLIIYDHHLLRETKYKEHTQPAWKVADDIGRNVLTTAEYLGQRPKVWGH